MGASFRSVGEIVELCGCDCLTISPALLETLMTSSDPLVPRLVAAESSTKYEGDKVSFDEKAFRWALNEDAMVIMIGREGGND